MKMSKKNNAKEPTPTKAELEVLQVLWKHGPSTVRFVHDAVNLQKEAVQYTSTLKLMQVMTEKGMLQRDEANMKHIYHAVLEEKKTKGFLLDRFVESMYHGSVGNMMLALLDNDKTSPEDLAKIKELLAKMGPIKKNKDGTSDLPDIDPFSLAGTALCDPFRPGDDSNPQIGRRHAIQYALRLVLFIPLRLSLHFFLGMQCAGTPGYRVVLRDPVRC